MNHSFPSGRRSPLMDWRSWLVAMLTIAGANALFPAPGHAADTNPIRVISSPIQDSQAGMGSSYAPRFSGDGRHLVFVSDAKNLVENDDLSPRLDVFIHDLVTTQTTLVSVNSSGIGGGQGNANFASLSSNGQVIVFISPSADLVSNTPTGFSGGVFVRDLVSAQTRCVSLDTDGRPAVSRRRNTDAVVSADGRWVVFTSTATNLVPGFTNTMVNLFTRDLWSNSTTLVSVNATPGRSATPYTVAMGSPELSADGRYVVFLTAATNLVPGLPGWHGDVYLRDLQAGATVWLSTNMGPLFNQAFPYDYECFAPVINPAGEVVVFKAASRAGSPMSLFRYDRTSGTTTAIPQVEDGASSESRARLALPAVSADGRFVAYEGATNVWLWDVVTGTNRLVSVNHDGTGPGNGNSHSPVMTPDGRRVAFLSAAGDLVTNTTSGCQIFVRDLAAGTTHLVTVCPDGTASDWDYETVFPAISPDGRLVAFESEDDQLVDGDLNQASDVFIRDLAADATFLVSRRHQDRPSLTTPAMSTLVNANCVSSNGQRVAFTSLDGGFPRDTNGWPDVFVRDSLTGHLDAVGFGTNATGDPVLSADGRFVAFVRGVTNETFSSFGAGNVGRYDVESGTTAPVSVTMSGEPAGLSSVPAISSDGRLVAFQTRAGGLVSQATPGALQIVVRDMDLGTNYLASVTRWGGYGDKDSFAPAFSPDGRWVIFTSRSADLLLNAPPQLSHGHLYARDLWSNQTMLVSKPPPALPGWPSWTLDSLRDAHVVAGSWDVVFAGTYSGIWYRGLTNTDNAIQWMGRSQYGDSFARPSVSLNRRYLVYDLISLGFPTLTHQVMLLDHQAQTTNIVSRSPAGEAGNGDSSWPAITPDGQFIVFASKASNLVADDSNGVSDMFVRDRLRNATLLVSVDRQGRPGTSPSGKPILAADGRTVVFQSFAGELADGDYNNHRDIFLLRLSAGDNDGDGLDDDWELAYFDTLNRDGQDDFDADGVNDRDEFLAGTDPTNLDSVLRAMILRAVGSETATVLWRAALGRSYSVEYTDTFDSPTWTPLPATVTVSGGTASAIVPNQTSQRSRFYRVVVDR